MSHAQWVMNGVSAPVREGDLLAGKYRIDRLLGVGTMGIVMAARHEQLDSQVAIKFAREDVLGGQDGIERFMRGARAAVRLKSEHVAKVLDVGALESGVPYMVMEYLEGFDLAQTLEAGGPMGVADAARLVAQACEAVAEAHGAGIVHRDLKPENLFMTWNAAGQATIKVLDFGISKCAGSANVRGSLTRTQGMIGSPLYMAPEQMRAARDVDGRADLWALGVVLFEILTRRWPFEAETLPELCLKVMTDAPQSLAAIRPDIPAGLVAVVERCLEKDRENRYGSANELAADLSLFVPAERALDRARPRLASGASASQSPMVASVSPDATLPPAKKRRSAASVAATVLSTLLVAGGAIWTVAHVRAPVMAAAEHPLVAARPAEVAAAPAAPSVQARGVTDDEVLLGMSAAFSGPSRELGNRMKLGVETAFARINDSGGVAGRALHLVALDDGYEGARAGENMKALLDHRKVFAILGDVGTPTAQVAAPYVVADKTIFFGAMTGSKILRQEPPDRYVFNYRASYEEETAAMVHYLVDAKKIAPQQIVVFAQHDAYGDAGFDGVAKTLRGYGQAPADILRASYERNTTDVDKALGDVVRYNGFVERLIDPAGNVTFRAKHAVKAVVLVATYKAAARFIQRAKDKGIDAMFLNLSFVDGSALAEELAEIGPGYAPGVVVTQVVPHVDSGGTGVMRYRDALKKYHPDQQPDSVSLEGYVVGNLFAEGLRRVGRDLTTEKLVDAFESIRDYDMGIGAILEFGMSQHQGSHKVWGTVIDPAGHFQPLEL